MSVGLGSNPASDYNFKAAAPAPALPSALAALVAVGSPGLHLRLDASAANASNPTAGKVNWAYGADTDYCDFRVHDNGDGTVSFESARQPNVFLAIIPASLSPVAAPQTAAPDRPWDQVISAANGTRMVLGTCLGWGEAAKFKLTPQSDGVQTVECAGFPGYFLVGDGTVVAQHVDGGNGRVGTALRPTENFMLRLERRIAGTAGQPSTAAASETTAVAIDTAMLAGFTGDPMNVVAIAHPTAAGWFLAYDPLTMDPATGRLGLARWSKGIDHLNLFKAYDTAGDSRYFGYESLAGPGNFLTTQGVLAQGASVDPKALALGFAQGRADDYWFMAGPNSEQAFGPTTPIYRGFAQGFANLAAPTPADANTPGKIALVVGNAAPLGLAQRADTHLSKDELIRAIETYGPILHIHPDEKYRMCTVEEFLRRATLVDNTSNPPRQLRSPRPTDLPTAGDITKIYLEPDVDFQGGNQPTARAYVHAAWSSGNHHTDLQFWFFYAFNGPGTAHVNGLELDTIVKSTDVDLSPLGDHPGDWECCVIRIDHKTLAPKAVFLAQHDAGCQFTTADSLKVFQRTGEQIHVYSSRNGHATYPAPGINPIQKHKYPSPAVPAGFEFYLRNDTAAGGPELDCAKHYEIVAADGLEHVFPQAPWLSYPLRWGPADTHVLLGDQAAPAVVKVLSGPLNAFAALLPGPIGSILVKLVETAATNFAPQIADHFSKQDINGPTGPTQKGGKWTGDYGFAEYVPPPPPPPPPSEFSKIGKDILIGANTVIDDVEKAPGIIVDTFTSGVKKFFGFFGHL